jgi:hypothetical protein
VADQTVYDSQRFTQLTSHSENAQCWAQKAFGCTVTNNSYFWDMTLGPWVTKENRPVCLAFVDKTDE